MNRLSRRAVLVAAAGLAGCVGLSDDETTAQSGDTTDASDDATDDGDRGDTATAQDTEEPTQTATATPEPTAEPTETDTEAPEDDGPVEVAGWESLAWDLEGTERENGDTLESSGYTSGDDYYEDLTLSGTNDLSWELYNLDGVVYQVNEDAGYCEQIVDGEEVRGFLYQAFWVDNAHTPVEYSTLDGEDVAVLEYDKSDLPSEMFEEGPDVTVRTYELTTYVSTDTNRILRHEIFKSNEIQDSTMNWEYTVDLHSYGDEFTFELPDLCE